MTVETNTGLLSRLAVDMSMAGDEYIAQVQAGSELIGLAVSSASDPSRAVAEELETGRRHLSPAQQNAYDEMLASFGSQMGAAAESASDGQRAPTSVPIPADADPDVMAAFQRTVMRLVNHVRKPTQDALLRRSMLALLISDFELLLGQVVKAVLRAQPSMLNAEEATLTLAELEYAQDIESARDLVIARKVDSLLRKDVEAWVQWFERFGVKWRDMVDNWPAFAEVFARRNVVVHAGGKVSDQYRGSLRSAGLREEDLPAHGAVLDLDEEYLQAASARLLAFGALLVSGTWLQLQPNDREPISWIVSRTESLLEDGFYREAATITATVLRHSRGRLPRAQEVHLKVFGWTARKQLGDPDVDKEVRVWEVDGLDLLLAHVKHVLLGEDDLAVRDIKTLVRRGELATLQLRQSPLYRDLMGRRAADLLGDAPPRALT